MLSVVFTMGDEKICKDLENYTEKKPIVFPYQENHFTLKDIHTEILEKMFKKIVPRLQQVSRKNFFSFLQNRSLIKIKPSCNLNWL